MSAPESLHPELEIIRRIAAGGMGEVLLANYQGDASKGISPGLLAVKRTLPDHSDKAHQDRMLLEEGRLAYRLRHENLVETFFLDARFNTTLLTMEYLLGRSMAHVLGDSKKNKRMLPFGVALNILRQAACGLHFAHTLTDGVRDLGLVHRDISPANIFVTFDGRVKVIDFGVAKADDSEIKTSTGILKGKIGYMAPEHAQGEKLDARADLWSLGVFFWESLVASRLFTNNNPALTLHQIIREDAKPPSTVRPDIPAPIDALCMKLLTRDRSKRILSAADLVMLIDVIAESDVPLEPIEPLLAQRFPDELSAAQLEIPKLAKSTAVLPKGLQEGMTISDEELDAATIVADRSELMNLAREIAAKEKQKREASIDTDMAKTQTGESNLASLVKQVADGPPVAAASTVSSEAKTMVTSADPLAAKAQEQAVHNRQPAAPPQQSAAEPGEDDIETVYISGESSPSSPSYVKETSTPPAPLSQPAPVQTAPPKEPEQQPLPEAPQPFQPPLMQASRELSVTNVALTTFGFFATVVGVVMASFFPLMENEAKVAAYVDANQTHILVAQFDLPPNVKNWEKINLKAPMLRTQTGQNPLSVSPEKLQAALEESGVWMRSQLPNGRNQIAKATLPFLIIFVGLFSFCIAVPSLMFARPGLMWAARLMLLTLLVLGSGFLIQNGQLPHPASLFPEVPPYLRASSL